MSKGQYHFHPALPLRQSDLLLAGQLAPPAVALGVRSNRYGEPQRNSPRYSRNRQCATAKARGRNRGRCSEWQVNRASTISRLPCVWT
jgi:hypothetical protein